ncbi:MAG: metallophosphoesterase [Rikenellaceae bacterium]
MKRKNIFKLLTFVVAAALSSCGGGAQQPFNVAAQFDAEKYDDRLNLFVVADGGRNGFYEQKSVAQQMGEIAEIVEPEVIISAGDTHHFDGVESVGDPLWISNFEDIYAHPELMVSWYPALGNHEYRGNTQAVLDYSNVSRRWVMPSRYYTTVFDEAGTTVRLVILDTPPLIDKYRNDPETYPDAIKQDMEAQLQWADSVLMASKEDWTIVVGHHPVYAYTTKNEQERIDMQQRVDPILRKHSVDMYICGHIHSFQHLRSEDCNIDYVVNSSASLARDVEEIPQTQFCSNREGFLILSADSDDLEAMMVDYNGELIYTVNRTR